jgi:hypothetical protein
MRAYLGGTHRRQRRYRRLKREGRLLSAHESSHAPARASVDFDRHLNRGRDRDRSVQRSMPLIVGDKRLRLLLTWAREPETHVDPREP